MPSVSSVMGCSTWRRVFISRKKKEPSSSTMHSTVPALTYPAPRASAIAASPIFVRSRSSTVVFGHWAALGLSLGPDAMGLDTGCVWGRSLTAVRLEDRMVLSEPAADEDLP